MYRFQKIDSRIEKITQTVKIQDYEWRLNHFHKIVSDLPKPIRVYYSENLLKKYLLDESESLDDGVRVKKITSFMPPNIQLFYPQDLIIYIVPMDGLLTRKDIWDKLVISSALGHPFASYYLGIVIGLMTKISKLYGPANITSLLLTSKYLQQLNEYRKDLLNISISQLSRILSLDQDLQLTEHDLIIIENSVTKDYYGLASGSYTLDDDQVLEKHLAEIETLPQDAQCYHSAIVNLTTVRFLNPQLNQISEIIQEKYNAGRQVLSKISPISRLYGPAQHLMAELSLIKEDKIKHYENAAKVDLGYLSYRDLAKLTNSESYSNLIWKEICLDFIINLVHDYSRLVKI